VKFLKKREKNFEILNSERNWSSMMYIDDKIRSMEAHLEIIQKEIELLKETLVKARTSWPENQIVPGAVWYDRSKTPHVIGKIWASDGFSVWTIWSNGTPIPKSAVSVKYWTDALMPAPPNPLEIL
jgi:hypothetical protein